MRIQLLNKLAPKLKVREIDFQSVVNEFELTIQERFELRKLMKVHVLPEAVTVEECMRKALVQAASFYSGKAGETL